MDSRLKYLQELRRFLKSTAKRSPKSRSALFLKHPDKKQAFYRYHNSLDEIDEEIAFNKQWRKTLRHNKPQIRAAQSREMQFQIAKDIIIAECPSGIRLYIQDLKNFIRDLLSDTKPNIGRKKLVPPEHIDVGNLQKLLRQHHKMERMNTTVDLSQFKLNQRIGMGYYQPYPRTPANGACLQYRADLLVLEGPWQNLEQTADGLGSILQQRRVKINNSSPSEQMYVPLPKGKPETHRLGLIVMDLTPCFFDETVDDETLRIPERTLADWQKSAKLNTEKIEQLIQTLGNVNDKFFTHNMMSALPKNHPFHPSNLKWMIERNSEHIISAQQRVTQCEEPEDLNPELIAVPFNPDVYIQQYCSKYKYKPPAEFSEEIKEYIRHNYRAPEPKSTTLMGIEFQEKIRPYRVGGYTQRHMLMSPYFPFSTSTELLTQIGLAIQGSFRDFLGYQIKLREHLYEPEVVEQVPIFRFSPQFGIMTHTKANDKHAFGQFNVVLNNPSDAERLYRLGVEIQEFDDGIGFVMTTQMDVQLIQNSNMELVCRDIADGFGAMDTAVTVTCIRCASLILKL